MIEFRTDRGDFAEIRIGGKCVMELCSDEHDLETAQTVAETIAASLNIEFAVTDMD